MHMALSLGFALLAGRCRLQPQTPLAAAAAADDVDAVRRLLAAGHSPRDGAALIWAVRRGAVAVMELLLDAGADPNSEDGSTSNWPPVVHAIHAQQPAALRMLLERSADPNGRLVRGFPTEGGG
jgi:ankyrin repeat protein